MPNVEISLSQFIDFTLKQGPSRVREVTKIKQMPPYHPALDYWRQLREAIREFHQHDNDIRILDQVLRSVDSRKTSNYTEVVKQYKRFCRGKNIKWFEPSRAFWSSGDLLVRATPELGLIIDGTPHRVKLYFKERSEQLAKRGTASTLTLMSESTFQNGDSDGIESVFNVRKGRLFCRETPVNEILRLSLESEASNFVYIWNRI